MTKAIYTNEHGAKYLAKILKVNKNSDSINYRTYEILVTHCIVNNDSMLKLVKPFSVYHILPEQLSQKEE
jgi:ribosomal protein S8E